MALVTLRLDGEWLDESTGASGPIAVESAFNYGALFELQEVADDFPGGAARLVLERQAAALFEEVDPRVQTEAAIGWQITENLVSRTTIHLE